MQIDVSFPRIEAGNPAPVAAAPLPEAPLPAPTGESPVTRYVSSYTKCPSCVNGKSRQGLACSFCNGDGDLLSSEVPLTPLEAALVANAAEVVALLLDGQNLAFVTGLSTARYRALMRRLK